ncbi:early nodulin-like protein 1 [Chenopodium quinoa]|uniref:early nodulin-like protein 1 n=1 Tax=Chenopodium quinoa TaxID=63459 RepID=UPI000B78457A|nr:early nodulin-like protein 1 [Chenopodium quinoa]
MSRLWDSLPQPVGSLSGRTPRPADQGTNFLFGGKDGWVLNPCKSYNHWAERNRFQVNDTLCKPYVNIFCFCLFIFMYVIKGDMGVSHYTQYIFGRSGPQYFISSSEDHCMKGQKLVIVVLAVRPKKPSPAPASAPTISPPSVSPAPSGSTPALSSKAPSPSPSDADAPSNGPNKSFDVGFTAFRINWLLSFAVGVGVFMFCFGWVV